MSIEEQTRGRMQTRQILGVCHRLVELIVRGISLVVAFVRGPAQFQPPIKDLTLLHSTTTLALKIRNRQVSFCYLTLFEFALCDKF